MSDTLITGIITIIGVILTAIASLAGVIIGFILRKFDESLSRMDKNLQAYNTLNTAINDFIIFLSKEKLPFKFKSYWQDELLKIAYPELLNYYPSYTLRLNSIVNKLNNYNHDLAKYAQNYNCITDCMEDAIQLRKDFQENNPEPPQPPKLNMAGRLILGMLSAFKATSKQ